MRQCGEVYDDIHIADCHPQRVLVFQRPGSDLGRKRQYLSRPLGRARQCAHLPAGALERFGDVRSYEAGCSGQ
jgi:hypothetical protein